MLSGYLSPVGTLSGSLTGVGGLSGAVRGIQFAGSGITATAADVKQGKTFANANGVLTDGTYLWNWMGDKAEFLGKIYDTTFALSTTTFDSWTPSTTAKAIKSAVTLSDKAFAADLTQYEYLIRWRCRFDAAYDSGATLKAQVYREVAEIWQTVFRRPNTATDVAAENYNYAVCTTLFTTPLTMYYNSSGNLTPYFSVAYGIYPSATAAAFSSTASDTPTITPKTPAYNARCSSTYFAVGRAPELDSANSDISIVGELYRIPMGSTMRTMFEKMIDFYND